MLQACVGVQATGQPAQQHTSFHRALHDDTDVSCSMPIKIPEGVFESML